MRFRLPYLLILLGLAAASGVAPAQTTDADDRRVITTESFLSSHPDLRYRLEGLSAFDEGRPDEALTLFRRAARYADKPSQSMLGEMHWNGTGTAQDRPMGYVWMDLAAERGYPMMVAKREHYWSALTEAERARALEIGAAVMQEYGDATAKRRIELVLKRARRNVTGSRVGSVGNLLIQIPTATGTRVLSGNDYYKREFWQPELYFQWQDQDWHRKGQATVEVGEVEANPTPGDRKPDDADD